MRISVVVPVWREDAILQPFLQHLRQRAPAAEVIVVEGDGRDSASRLAAGLADRWLKARRGRAHQMNIGAQSASGEVLWFMHADSRIPANAVAKIEEALQDRQLAGGCFRLRLPRAAWIYRVSDTFGNVGVDLFRIALGDHGIFCRREVFHQIGGYPDIPIMEDAEFYRALGRFGRTRQLAEKIETSPRRYEAIGPYRTTARYALILALYLIGMPPSFLQRIYDRLLGQTGT